LGSWNWREWDRLGGEGKSSGKGNGSLSIEGLTERECGEMYVERTNEGIGFIAGLNVTHPATVSTINKTGDKLVFAGGRDIREKLCPLCEM
jgi:cytoplasmic tRNA 2-thiolation protein 2